MVKVDCKIRFMSNGKEVRLEKPFAISRGLRYPEFLAKTREWLRKNYGAHISDIHIWVEEFDGTNKN